MIRYAKGRRFEYEVIHDLESLGYTVTRSAGSKGDWDLVARKRDARSDRRLWIALFIQAEIRKA